jgi:hypothetical protein
MVVLRVVYCTCKSPSRGGNACNQGCDLSKTINKSLKKTPGISAYVMLSQIHELQRLRLISKSLFGQ